MTQVERKRTKRIFAIFMALIFIFLLTFQYSVYADDESGLIHGLDICYFQGNVDFKSAHRSGTEFVIIRDGWGEYDMDPKLIPYATAATAAGIDVVGVYHFIYASNVQEAILNAEQAIRNVQQAGLPKSTVIWCDLEYDTVDNARDYRGVNLSAKDQRDFAEAFCDTVLAAGYPTGVYVNADYLYNVFGTSIMNKYDIWLADWSSVYYQRFPCVYHQTGYGNYPGFTGYVDFDVYRGQYTTGTAKPHILLGDANEDGNVDSDDAMFVLQFYAKLKPFINKYNADVNHDNVVDSDDASLILQYYAGLISSFE